MIEHLCPFYTWLHSLLAEALRPPSPTMLRLTVGTQPQGDVGWLHRLLHHTHQVVAKGVQVRFVSQRRGEGFQGLPRVVLPTVEAPVYERLDAPPQGREQGRYHQRGDDYSELFLLLLAGKGPEDSLGRRHGTEIEARQDRGQSTVDQGAVDDEIYVP